LQAEDIYIPTDGLVLPPIAGLQCGKKWAGVSFFCQCRPYQLTGNLLCLRKWGTSLLDGNRLERKI